VKLKITATDGNYSTLLNDIIDLNVTYNTPGTPSLSAVWNPTGAGTSEYDGTIPTPNTSSTTLSLNTAGLSVTGCTPDISATTSPTLAADAGTYNYALSVSGCTGADAGIVNALTGTLPYVISKKMLGASDFTYTGKPTGITPPTASDAVIKLPLIKGALAWDIVFGGTNASTPSAGPNAVKLEITATNVNYDVSIGDIIDLGVTYTPTSGPSVTASWKSPVTGKSTYDGNTPLVNPSTDMTITLNEDGLDKTDCVASVTSVSPTLGADVGVYTYALGVSGCSSVDAAELNGLTGSIVYEIEARPLDGTDFTYTGPTIGVAASTIPAPGDVSINTPLVAGSLDWDIVFGPLDAATPSVGNNAVKLKITTADPNYDVSVGDIIDLNETYTVLVPSITVGSQIGDLTTEADGSATYQVTLTDWLTDPETFTNDQNPIIGGTKPNDVAWELSIISSSGGPAPYSGMATLTVTTDMNSVTVVNESDLTLTIGGVESETFSLLIESSGPAPAPAPRALGDPTFEFNTTGVESDPWETTLTTVTVDAGDEATIYVRPMSGVAPVNPALYRDVISFNSGRSAPDLAFNVNLLSYEPTIWVSDQPTFVAGTPGGGRGVFKVTLNDWPVEQKVNSIVAPIEISGGDPSWAWNNNVLFGDRLTVKKCNDVTTNTPANNGCGPDYNGLYTIEAELSVAMNEDAEAGEWTDMVLKLSDGNDDVFGYFTFKIEDGPSITFEAQDPRKKLTVGAADTARFNVTLNNWGSNPTTNAGDAKARIIGSLPSTAIVQMTAIEWTPKFPLSLPTGVKQIYTGTAVLSVVSSNVKEYAYPQDLRFTFGSGQLKRDSKPPVELEFVLPTPLMTASPSSVSFGVAVEDYMQPGARTVTVRNGTNAGKIINMYVAPAPTGNYDIGALSRTSIDAGTGTASSATFTVRPISGLRADGGVNYDGSYDDIITVKGENERGVEVSADVVVSFNVVEDPVYTIRTSDLGSFGSVVSGYTQPAAKTVTIYNTGTGAVTLYQPSASSNYTLGNLGKAVVPAGDSTTFTVRPKPSLPIGNYDEVIAINGSNDVGATVLVSFDVVSSPIYDISASALDPFESVVEPYTQPAAKTVTVTNTGTSTIVLVQPVSTTGKFIIGTLTKTSVNAGDSAKFTVRPMSNLTYKPDPYEENIQIGAKLTASSTDIVKKVTVLASFAVTNEWTPVWKLVAAPQAVSFGSVQTSAQMPYVQPAAKSVTITNIGTERSWLSVNAQNGYFNVALSASAYDLTPGKSATLSIRPIAGLEADTYVDEIEVTGSHGESVTIPVTFTVTKPPVYTITATPGSVLFVPAVEGYSQAPGAQTVTITNTGTTGTVTLDPLPVSADFTITGLTPANRVIAAGGTATFTVQPKLDLRSGIHEEPIKIRGSNDAEASVVLSFTVEDDPTYTISASPTPLNFGSLLGPTYTPPGAKTVTITNTGTSAVTGLTVSRPSAYDIGGTLPQILAAGGSATFTVRPKAGLTTNAVGSNYNDTIKIDGSNGAGASVVALFEVALTPRYEFSVSDEDLWFGSSVEGYKTPPAAKTVTITNTGTSPITFSKPVSSEFNSTHYEIGTLSSTTVAAGGTATFTVRPNAGLGLGAHDEVITIKGTSNGHNLTAEVSVSFYVTDEDNPTHEIIASQLTSFGSVQEPYTPPQAKTVTVTNIGTGAVTLSIANPQNFTVGPPSPETVAPGKTATFVVRPKEGLPSNGGSNSDGYYEEDISITGAPGGLASVTASFSVTEAPDYTIALSPSSMSFTTAVKGYGQVATKEVTVRNTSSSGSITLTQLPTTSPNNFYALTQLTKLSVNAGDSAKFTIRPQNGLPAGIYEERIVVSGGKNGATTGSILVTFVVVDSPVSAITATPLAPFGTKLGPSYMQPDTQIVTVRNVGTTAVTLTKPTSVSFYIGNLSKTSVPAGDSATFKVVPKADLNFGTYYETIVINGSNNVSAEVIASFAVVMNPVDSLNASPSVVQFGSVIGSTGVTTDPYTPPPAQTITVANTGTSALTGLTVTGSSDFKITALTATSLAAGATAKFTVQPENGLRPGDYNPTITIEGTVSGGTKTVSADVRLSFSVTTGLTYRIIASPDVAPFDSVQIPYTQPYAKTITITNIGTGDVALIEPSVTNASSNYVIGNLTPTNVVAAGKTVTFTVRPKAGLAANDYNETINIVRVNTTTPMASVSASFRVKPAPGITIITQPQDKSVALGAITGSLNVEAYIAPSAPMTFKWYKPATAGAASGTLVATMSDVVPAPGSSNVACSFPIPTNLASGTHYYYVVVSAAGATDVKSNVAMVTVSSIEVTELEPFVPVIYVAENNPHYIQPAAQTVVIRNKGTTAITLQQPSSSESNSSYIISGLSSTSLPSRGEVTFTVRPKGDLTGSADGKEYNEVITIRGNNGAISIINASFTVYTQPAYKIKVSQLASFGSLPTPYQQPPVQTVIITNIGTEPIVLDPLPSNDEYELGPLTRQIDGVPMNDDRLLTNGAKATFTIRPMAGLPEGVYSNTIVISGSNGAFATISPWFEVAKPLTFALGVSPLTTFGHVYSTPYTVPAQQIVTIENTGTGPIKDLELSASNSYNISALSTRNLGANGSTATFTIRPKANLPIGNHDEHITISGLGTVVGDSVVDVSVVIHPTFTVAPVRTINAAIPLEPNGDFGELDEGYELPDVQIVVITNTCDSVVTLTQPTSVDYMIGTLSKFTLRHNGDTASFTVRPKSDLEPGLHDEDIIIACGPGGASVTVPVLFSVAGNPRYEISASQTLVSFGSLRAPYTRPAAQTVVVTNMASNAVVLNDPPESENYEITLSTNSLPARGSRATLTIRPKAGLDIGNHDEEIVIEGTGDAKVVVTASFNVTSPSVFAITFNPMGGVVNPTSATTVNGKIDDLPIPDRFAYTFVGWFTSASGGAAVTTSTVFRADAVIYARWTAAGPYDVTFRSGENGALAASVDGSGIASGTPVAAGKNVVFAAEPIDGYRVVRWTINGAVVTDTSNVYIVPAISRALDVVVTFDRDVSVATPDRVIPGGPVVESAVVTPSAFTAGLTAGPSPVEKFGGVVSFYRNGQRLIGNASLYIFDASGNVVNKVYLTDNAGGKSSGRKVGEWNLRNATGHVVPEGTYLVKGVLKTPDGKRELVSLTVRVQ
jgi:hypothetical protein